ncbi:hypothetical protein SDC9_110860 [bioreactor metagenome]|uniref:Uncharacterized protein n=1 Tax=bioreactor metagenome TaxID=1076179 RepID=A0A645BEU2_9ZZZZ
MTGKQRFNDNGHRSVVKCSMKDFIAADLYLRTRAAYDAVKTDVGNRGINIAAGSGGTDKEHMTVGSGAPQSVGDRTGWGKVVFRNCAVDIEKQIVFIIVLFHTAHASNPCCVHIIRQKHAVAGCRSHALAYRVE